MKNIKPFMKRVLAYTIDMVIVLMLSSLISSIPFLNKGHDDYQQTYKEYEKEYNKYSEYTSLINSSYKDEKITEEEYTKLLENNEYKGIIEEKYEDKEISQDEYDDIIEKINKSFDNIAKEYIYILSKKGISNSIITLLCTLLYFGVIQYLLKGETIGKKIFKIKVISASTKKLNIFNYILRSLVVNDVFLNIVGIIFLAFTSKAIYQKADTVITTLISVIEGVIIFLVLTREDKRGLHDLLFNTKVISIEETETKETIETERHEIKEKSNKKKN